MDRESCYCGRCADKYDQCDDECLKKNSPFAPNYSCRSNSDCSCGEDTIDSGSDYQNGCEDHEHFRKLPIIVDRRYNFANREICSRHFSLRLGGLTNFIAANLWHHHDCEIKIGYQCEGNVEKIRGKVTYVGTDFVEIKRHDRDRVYNRTQEPVHQGYHPHEDYLMIPFDSINWLDF